ncbi:MAG: hypothetical protein EOO04_36355, partial [Chitinophagaceae bacterium]
MIRVRNMIHIIRVLIAAATVFTGLLFFSYRNVPVAEPAPVLPLPSEKQLRYHEMEMNAFIHFTT